jgi:hypothetical protein
MMKTCRQFALVRVKYEWEIRFMLAHSERYEGTQAAKSSAQQAASAKRRMARALNTHIGHCPECG